MVVNQRSRNGKGRKETGGRYRKFRKKMLFEKGNRPMETKVGKTKIRVFRTRGGHAKKRLLECDIVNILDKKTNISKKGKIKSVIKSNSSRHYVRRNVITKGAIVETDQGNALVTNRPGQEATINAVLIK